MGNTIKLSSLRLNPRNPRQIRDERFAALCKSLKDFLAMMELRPIITDADGVILGGNMRFRALQANGLTQPQMPGNVFFQGNKFWAVEGMGTDSLCTVVQSAICLRGTEKDSENMMRIARATKYWRAASKHKEATLRKLFDVPALFAKYDRDTLPTRYIKMRAKGAT